MTNKLFLLLIILLSAQNAISQILEGFWQEDNNLIAAGYLGGYTFSKDTFKYSINEFDGLNPIRTIGGFYSIKNGIITFCATYMQKNNECIGLHRDELGSISDNWTWGKFGKLVTIKLVPKVKASATFKKEKDFIKIDDKKYYRIDLSHENQ